MAEVCVFVVDDDFLIAQTVEDSLADGGFVFVTAHSGTEASTLLEERGSSPIVFVACAFFRAFSACARQFDAFAMKPPRRP